MDKDMKSLIAFLIGVVVLFFAVLTTAFLIINSGITSEGVGRLFGAIWIVIPFAAVALTAAAVLLSSMVNSADEK